MDALLHSVVVLRIGASPPLYVGRTGTNGNESIGPIKIVRPIITIPQKREALERKQSIGSTWSKCSTACCVVGSCVAAARCRSVAWNASVWFGLIGHAPWVCTTAQAGLRHSQQNLALQVSHVMLLQPGGRKAIPRQPGQIFVIVASASAVSWPDARKRSARVVRCRIIAPATSGAF